VTTVSVSPQLERIRNRRGWALALALALLAFAAWAVVTARIHHPSRFWNFGYIHDGSLCLIDRCDPFDSHALDAVGPRHGEPPHPPLNPEYPVYPPATLLLAVPLIPLGWPGAAWAIFAVSFLSFATAAAAIVWSVRFRPWICGGAVLLALFVSRSPWLGLYYANPVLLGAGLTTGACVLLLDDRRRHLPAAITLLALALCIKPQLALGAVVFFFWKRDTRKAAAWACGLFVAFSVLAVIVYAVRLGGFGYLATERRILALGFQTGHSSDGSLRNPFAFEFVNLQPLFSWLGLGPKTDRLAACAVTAAIGALVFAAGRSRNLLERRPWTMLSLVLLLSLMPMYHREYDRCLLLALAPAAMELEQDPAYKPWLLWLLPATAAVWFCSEWMLLTFLPGLQGVPLNAACTLALAGLLLWSLLPGSSNTAAA